MDKEEIKFVSESDMEELMIYVNGSEDDSDPTFTAPDSKSTNWELATDGNYFGGKLDEIRIYNRALSSAEVSNLYNFASGPVAYWKMDENTGGSAYDSSGNGNTGSLGGGTADYKPQWSKGKMGSALKYDYSNDYVSVSDSSSIDIISSFSIAAWIKFTSLPSAEHYCDSIVTKNSGYNHNYYIDICGATPKLGVGYRADPGFWGSTVIAFIGISSKLGSVAAALFRRSSGRRRDRTRVTGRGKARARRVRSRRGHSRRG